MTDKQQVAGNDEMKEFTPEELEMLSFGLSVRRVRRAALHSAL